MTIVITGIGGLLGRELARHARAHGHWVVGVARRNDPTLAGLADQLVFEDLCSGTRQDWSSLAGEAVVFHLAADTQIYGMGEEGRRNNVDATVAACAIARQTGGRLVFFSSSAVYSGPGTGHPIAALAENAATAPATAYGQSKKIAEEIIAQSGVSAMVLRIFGVLSEDLAARSPRGNLVQAIMRSLGSGEELVLGEDEAGRPAVRDYVLSGDVCRLALQAGVILAGDGSAANRTQVVNLCTGVATSTWEMARQAQAAAGRIFPVRFEPRHSGENAVMVGDASLLRQVFGRVPCSRVREFWEREVTAGNLAPCKLTGT